MSSRMLQLLNNAEEANKTERKSLEALHTDDLKVVLELAGVKTKGLNPKQMIAKVLRHNLASAVNRGSHLTKDEINDYDHIIVAYSGGKDSQACFLHLLDIGVNLGKVELWHHDVDGREGSDLMDWDCTRSYCQEFAKAFGVPIYFSWKKGGFEGEMTREESLTQPTCFEVPGGEVIEVGGVTGKKNTRMMFPQVSANLSTRWCSSYLKISVCGSAISNQRRFNGKKVLLLTGERAEESSNRASYAKFEKHSTNGKNRTVHQYRPVHGYAEDKVWALLCKYRINVHPAYHLGMGSRVLSILHLRQQKPMGISKEDQQE